MRRAAEKLALVVVAAVAGMIGGRIGAAPPAVAAASPAAAPARLIVHRVESSEPAEPAVPAPRQAAAVAPARDAHRNQGCAAGMSAMAAQLVAPAETHWSWPWGKPLSKYGWNGRDRDRTYHEPSSSCVSRRNFAPRW